MGTHMLIRANPSRSGGLDKPAHLVWGTEWISALGGSYDVLEGRNPTHALVLLKKQNSEGDIRKFSLPVGKKTSRARKQKEAATRVPESPSELGLGTEDPGLRLPTSQGPAQSDPITLEQACV